MQIVIDIPDDDYYDILQYAEVKVNTEFENLMIVAIKDGTSLPKGHGRLIDADEYKEHMYACETNGRPLHRMELVERLATVDDAPTIIEADKAERENKE